MSGNFDTIQGIKDEIKNMYLVQGKEKGSVPPEDLFVFRGQSRIYEKLFKEPTTHSNVISTLFREHYENVISLDLDNNGKELLIGNLKITEMQKEIIEKSKLYLTEPLTDVEIVTKLQHYGGATNFIDFSSSFEVALFFACNDNMHEDGEVVCYPQKQYDIVNEDDEINWDNDFILYPRLNDNRVKSQKSVFVYSKIGVLSVFGCINFLIKKEHKPKLLEELREKHNISEYTMYADIHGIIKNRENFKLSDTFLFAGMAEEKNKNYEKAIHYFLQVIERKPNDAYAFARLANAYCFLGIEQEENENYDSAFETLNESVEFFEHYFTMEKRYLQLILNMANVRERLGYLAIRKNRKDLAVEYFKGAIFNFNNYCELYPDEKSKISASIKEVESIIQDIDGISTIDWFWENKK